MRDRNSATDWPWLVSGAMFEMKGPLNAVTGWVRLLEAKGFGGIPEEIHPRVLRRLLEAAGAIREGVDALSDLASLEGAWPTVQLERAALRKLLTDVASHPPLVGRLVDIRVADEHAEVIAASPVFERALAGLARVTVPEERDNPRPVSIWAVDPPSASERWIVLAATEKIEQTVGTPRERLAPMEEGRGPLSMDFPLAWRVVRAHGGQLFALPDGMQGAVVVLPRPA